MPSLNISVPSGQLIPENEEEPPSIEPPRAKPAPAQVLFFDPPSTPPISSFQKKNIRSLPRTVAFRRKFFPTVSDKQWNDWHWQVINRIRRPHQLAALLNLSKEEQDAFDHSVKLPLSITPYFMSLLNPDEPAQPLRRTVVPTVHEFTQMPGEEDDPLGEEAQSPIPGLVHRYPDRALLLVLDFCSTYCRYCTRSRLVGKGAILPKQSRLEKAIEYIRSTPSIRDVLLSGGDPLTLSDGKLDWLLTRLRQIPHVEIIRIGTKIPAVLPQRITYPLVRMLKKHHPLWMSLHFTHPDECTPEAYRACGKLADGGIPLGSQTVLLKGINNDVDTMKALVHHLLKMRVRPYYLYQCDSISGSGHFRTTVENGMEIIRGLRGHTSGYAVPNYVIDAPKGGGKIPVMPDYVVGYEGHDLVLRNYENKTFRYTDSACRVQ
ncbi:MAG: KamA family radical SAM protein [Pseudomonadota bacterium]